MIHIPYTVWSACWSDPSPGSGTSFFVMFGPCLCIWIILRPCQLVYNKFCTLIIRFPEKWNHVNQIPFFCPSSFLFCFVFRIAGSASVWWTYQIERLVGFDGWQNELFSWWSTFLKVFSPPTSASLSMILKCFQWCLFDWKARPLIWKDGGMSYIGMTSIFPCQCRYVLCAVHQCRKRT